MNKKLIIITLILSIILGSFPLGFGITESKAANDTGYLVLGDFSGAELDNRVYDRGSSMTQDYVRQNTDVKYGSGEGSLEWILDNKEIEFYLDDGIDWTGYTKVHLRMRSSVDQKINIIFVGHETDYDNSNKKAYTKVAISSSGEWQELTYDISAFSSVLANNNNEMGIIRFNNRDWSNTEYVAGSSIFIDKIWLTKDFEITSTNLPTGTNKLQLYTTGNFVCNMTFSNPLDENTDYTDYISLKKDGTDVSSIITDVSVDSSSLLITVPYSSLDGESEYTVSIADTMKDAGTNTITGDLSFSFDTGAAPLTPDEPGYLTLVNLNGSTLDSCAKKNTTATLIQNTSVKYGNASGSLEWKMPGEIYIDFGAADWTKFSKVNIRLCSNAANNTVNAVFVGGEEHNGSNRKVIDLVCPATAGEWVVISYDISTFANVLTANNNEIGMLKLNSSGWSNTDWVPDSSIYIDSIWLTSADYGTTMANPVPGIANGAGYVEGDLGGSNTLSFTFPKVLAASSDASIVSVYEVEGTNQALTQQPYSVCISGDKLDVIFENELENNVYKVVLDSSKIRSEHGARLAADFETVFSVGMESVIFNASSTEPADGATAVSPFEDDTFTYKINFNHNLKTNIDYADYITMKKGEDDVSSIIESISPSGKTLAITMPSDSLSGNTKYTVTINPALTNLNGKEISGDLSFEFTTGVKPMLARGGVVFDASNEEDMSLSKGDIYTEGTYIYDEVSGMDYAANASQKERQIGSRSADLNDYYYINYLIYNSQAGEFNFNLKLYNVADGASENYLLYHLSADFSGWCVKSIPIGDFKLRGTPNLEDIDGYRVNIGGWSSAAPHNGSMKIGKIWLTDELPSAMELDSVSLPDSYAQAAIAGQKITFTFNSQILQTVTPNISVVSAGGAVTDYTVNSDGNEITLSFGYLAPSTGYTVNISNVMSTDMIMLAEPVSYSFTTAADGIYINSFNLTPQSITAGSAVTATAVIDNMTNANKNVTFVMLAQNADGQLVSSTEENVVLSHGSNTITKSITPSAATKYIKSYVLCDNKILDDKFVTLHNSEFSLVESSVSSEINSNITTDAIEQNGDIVTIAAKATMKNAILSLKVKNPAGSVIVHDVLKSRNDGTIDADIQIPSDCDTGIYSFNITSNGKTKEGSFSFVDSADRTDFLTLANGSDASALAGWIITNKAVIGIGAASAQYAADIANYIISKEAYSTYDNAYADMMSLIALFNKLNSTPWQNMAQLISDNTNTLLLPSSTMKAYFASLDGTGKNTICIQLANKVPFASISEFSNELDYQAGIYKDSLLQTQGGPAGAPTTSASASVGGAQTPSNTVAPVDTLDVFSDLSGFEWAKKSILTLYDAKIISHAADGRYRPADNITREEFVKLLVESFFAQHIASDEAIYADAPVGTWYNKYLAAASRLGITTGKGDGSFGVGESITREDMVTMAARAVELRGIILSTDTDSTFTDATSISAYAVPYVNALVSDGILSGMGDGSFSPKSNANRAQAAKVVCALMEKYN